MPARSVESRRCLRGGLDATYGSAETRRWKVLLAEDARFARNLLQGALAGWGYEVVLAEDGEQAWRALEGPDAPSVALLDWMMPGLDGLQVTRTRMPPTVTAASATDARSLSAAALAPAASHPASTTTNSSPPYRPTRS